MDIPVFRPTMRRREMDSVLTCMVTDRIGPGNVALRLAQDIADYLGLAGGIAFVSYRLALRAALEALDLRAGDRVAVSALSPLLHQRVLVETGLVPVVVDVDESTGCMSFEAVQRSADVFKAILVSYTLGFVPEMDNLKSLNIPIVEDISQGLGAQCGEVRSGGFGDLTVLSLGYDGIITGGSGGVVLARGKTLLRQMKDRMVGSDTSLADLNASLAVAQLKVIDEFLTRRRDIFDAFRQSAMRSRHEVPFQKGDCIGVPYSFPVLIATDVKAVVQYARKHNIEVLPAFQESVLSSLESAPIPPVAQRLSLRCLLFPLYPMLGRKHMESVCRLLSTLP